MTFDLYDVLDNARGDAPPPRRSVDDIVAAGRGMQRRRRLTVLTGGMAAVLALAAGTAVTLPHLGGGQPDAMAGAGGAGTERPVSFPTLTAPFMISMKGYSVGAMHVSDPVLATAGYQEARISLDGVPKQKVVNSMGTWERSYDTSVGVLTVFRPGVFKPDAYKSGTPVQVRGLSGYQTTITVQVADTAGRPAGANAGASFEKPKRSDVHDVQVPALAWQYTDGAWATIVTNAQFKSTDPTKDLLALAAGLTPTTPSLVKLPYRFGAAPAGYHLVAVGTSDPESFGENISEAYFAKADLPMTGLTGRYHADDFFEARGGTLKVIVAETAPAAPSDPYPHPNPKHPCQAGFCDRAINDGWFAEVSEGTDNMAVVHAVTDGLVFDNPTDPATWHDVTAAGLPK